MQKKYKTSRLILRPLNLRDAPFILELLNTEGWLKFIGDRNISNLEDSRKYIQKIMSNPQILYWVVRREKDPISLGVVTFIKRNYLEHWDIGFAFLPAFFQKGYALESAEMVLHQMLKNPLHKTIFATTLPDNNASIKLIQKMGFHFNKEIENEKVKLLLFSLTDS